MIGRWNRVPTRSQVPTVQNPSDEIEASIGLTGPWSRALLASGAGPGFHTVGLTFNEVRLEVSQGIESWHSALARPGDTAGTAENPTVALDQLDEGDNGRALEFALRLVALPIGESARGEQGPETPVVQADAQGAS